MEDSAPRRGRVTFGWLVGLSQVLGLVSVVLAGVWMGQYRGGFAWDGSAQQFNVHPLCMVLGLVFLQGDGESKKRIKKNPFGTVCVTTWWQNALIRYHEFSSNCKPTCSPSNVYLTSSISEAALMEADRNVVTAFQSYLQRYTKMIRNAEHLRNL